MQHELGTWQSRWEFLGPDGKVAQVWEGTETFQPGPSDRVVIVETEVPEVGNKSISIRFYHPIERKIYFASVGQNGDFWLLTEPVGSSVLTSEPHMNADGSVSTIRFTTLEKDDDSMKVLMEQSRDGGKTWRPVFRQYLTRSKQN
ncbi:MAG TPA: hypothetical protein VLV83_18540 [Acidobacteriota bacterium]|nr:hypothetical protein [Acidobacteriota bacterium]